MRVLVPARSLFLFFALVPTVLAQQTAPTTQPGPILQRALSVLVPSGTVTDITLTGTARRIAGSDDESGTVVLKALATGESRVELTFPSGPRTETRIPMSVDGPRGAWSGPDNAAHAISQHNLWTDPSWFFPAFAISRALSADAVASYVGQEAVGATTLHHFSVTRQFQTVGAPPGWTPDALQRLATTDIYLDTATFLPSSISFKTHPDRNASMDIPVEIRFSDYRLVNGVQIAFHIQKFFNNSLALDIQLQNASTNTGLTAAAFSAAQVQ